MALDVSTIRAAPWESPTSSPIDFRLPQYRRAVFQDFYEFHLRYKSHPGCVYYLLPYLKERYGWDDEQALWFSFINGNTQNPVTSLIMFRRGGSPHEADALVRFWSENYARLDFDMDRRYHKKGFHEATASYLRLVNGAQRPFWERLARDGFARMWPAALSIARFGRLSAYSYLEYLRINGIDFDCDNLMLGDSGSRSHRNGLCIVLGLDEYDHHQSNPTFDGRYSAEFISILEREGLRLLAEAKRRARGRPWEHDVSFFTLESALCTYKSWHRPDRRYPNVYNDMLHERIKRAEALWPEEDLSIFWQARRATLPAYLRLEDTPGDLGVHPDKQNHYRLTGQVIMMERDYPQYQNDYATAVARRAEELRA